MEKINKLLRKIMDLAGDDMYYGYPKYRMIFANIESEIHLYIFHDESIENINLIEETKQIKELIDAKELDCIEFYEMLVEANEILNDIKKK